MSIKETISRTAATHPSVGVALARQSVKSALLTSVQSSDAATSALLAAIADKTQTTSSSVASLVANAAPNIGKNINTAA